MDEAALELALRRVELPLTDACTTLRLSGRQALRQALVEAGINTIALRTHALNTLAKQCAHRRSSGGAVGESNTSMCMQAHSGAVVDVECERRKERLGNAAKAVAPSAIGQSQPASLVLVHKPRGRAARTRGW